MSYTHIHLPDIERLKKYNSEQLKFYAKYDTIIGSNESIEYLNQQLKKL